MRFPYYGITLISLLGCSSEPVIGFADAALPLAVSDGGASFDAAAESSAADTAPEAGALGAACDPQGARCDNGLLCFSRHTDPQWGCNAAVGCQPDLYGHCYIACGEGQDGINACAALGGLCGCPIIQDSDASWECLPDGSDVCVRSTR